jgi:hypothetical protein
VRTAGLAARAARLPSLGITGQDAMA